MPASDLVKSVGRALDIVELVAGSDAGLTLAELSRTLALNATTVHNLARTLAAKGFLEKSGRPVRYAVGPAFLEIARRTRESRLLGQAALVLRDLSRRYPGVTWTLVQKNGPEFLVKLRMSPEQSGVLQKPEHRSMSPFSSASALVYQAFLPPDELESLYERYPFDEYGQHRWFTRERFDAFLASVRQKGYAMPGSTDGRLIAAVPVFAGERQVAAVVGGAVACPPADTASTLDTLARELLQAAARMKPFAPTGRPKRSAP